MIMKDYCQGSATVAPSATGTIAEYYLPEDGAGLVNAVIIGKNDAAGIKCVFEIAVAFERFSGNLILGSVTQKQQYVDPELTGVSATFDSSGSIIRARFTSIANQTMNMEAHMDVFYQIN